MWVKQCHEPPMTGNGNHTTYKNGDDWGVAIAIPDAFPAEHAQLFFPA